MNSEEKIKIDLLLKRLGREDLKSSYMYERSYLAVKEILEMPEWNDIRFKPLLTSTIWNSNANEIKRILYIKHPTLKTEEGEPMLIWDDPKYTPLLTSSIWGSNATKIKEVLYLPHPLDENKIIWNDDKFKHLLVPSIWSISIKRFKETLKTFIELKLEDYVTISSLRKSPKMIRTLYEYLVENGIPVIVDSKLHSIFSISNKAIEKKYGKKLVLTTK